MFDPPVLTFQKSSEVLFCVMGTALETYHFLSLWVQCAQVFRVATQHLAYHQMRVHAKHIPNSIHQSSWGETLVYVQCR